jgi:hypothetical protein
MSGSHHQGVSQRGTWRPIVVNRRPDGTIDWTPAYHSNGQPPPREAIDWGLLSSEGEDDS